MRVEERKKMLHKCKENPSWSQQKTANVIGIPKSIVEFFFKRFRANLSVEQVEENGRKKGPSVLKLAQKIIKSIHQNLGLLDRNRAKKYEHRRKLGEKRF